MSNEHDLAHYYVKGGNTLFLRVMEELKQLRIEIKNEIFLIDNLKNSTKLLDI
jgi:hypothetical protein